MPPRSGEASTLTPLITHRTAGSKATIPVLIPEGHPRTGFFGLIFLPASRKSSTITLQPSSPSSFRFLDLLPVAIVRKSASSMSRALSTWRPSVLILRGILDMIALYGLPMDPDPASHRIPSYTFP